MTNLDLTKLREIANSATEGDWERVVDNDSRRPIEVSIWSEVANYYPVEGMVIGNPNHMADAAHITAFDPPTILALIDEVERLRRIRTDLTDIAVKNNIKAGDERG